MDFHVASNLMLQTKLCPKLLGSLLKISLYNLKVFNIGLDKVQAHISFGLTMNPKPLVFARTFKM